MRALEFSTNIFTNTTGMPTYDDMLRDPEYFAKQKSKVFKIIKMSPDAYLAACKAGLSANTGTFTPEQNLVDEYAERVKAGSKMPMPVLEYELNEYGQRSRGSYTSFSQEGRHRAYVAKQLGVTVIPVMVVAAAYPPPQFRDVFPEFVEKIWSKFNA